MLSIEIHVDNVEEKQASPRVSKQEMDATVKESKVRNLLAKLQIKKEAKTTAE